MVVEIHPVDTLNEILLVTLTTPIRYFIGYLQTYSSFILLVLLLILQRNPCYYCDNNVLEITSY